MQILAYRPVQKKRDTLNSANKIKNVRNNFFWLDVTELEIFNIIKNLDSNKANGYDNMSEKVLKKLAILSLKF